MMVHGYPYSFHTTDVLPHTLANLNTAGVYVSEVRQRGMPDLNDPTALPFPPFFSIARLDKFSPFFEFKDNLGAPVDIRGLEVPL